jgi:hypothetical protein
METSAPPQQQDPQPEQPSSLTLLAQQDQDLNLLNLCSEAN